jgi:hypothetical protein
MIRPVGRIAVALSLLFLVCARSASERGDNVPPGPRSDRIPAPKFVEGGLPLPQTHDREVGVGGDPRVWASMLTELQSAERHL